MLTNFTGTAIVFTISFPEMALPFPITALWLESTINALNESTFIDSTDSQLYVLTYLKSHLNLSTYSANVKTVIDFFVIKW